MNRRILIAAAHNDSLFRAAFNSHWSRAKSCKIDVLTCKEGEAEFHGILGISTLYLCEAFEDGLRQIGPDYDSIIALIVLPNGTDDMRLSPEAIKIIQPLDVVPKDVFVSHESPLILRVEPTNYCSARCRMCSNRYIVRKYGRRELSPEAIDWDFLHSVKDIVLLQNGEFTEAQFLKEWLRATSDLKARLHVTTNGSRLTTGLLHELVDAGLSSVTFSIDSTDPAIFSNIRFGCELERILEGLDAALDLSYRAHHGRPIVQVNITLQMRNIWSLTRTCLDLAERGVDAIHIEYARIHPENVEAGDMVPSDSLYFEQALADDFIFEAISAVNGFACDLSAPPPFRRKGMTEANRSVTSYCWQPFTDLVVWANGDVTPCIGAQSFILGNIRVQSLPDIWHGNIAQNFRSRVASVNPPDECNECICGGRWNGRVFEKDWHIQGF
jgi:radical SAM protein with 4Fe4S-binding SPASM domain